MASSKEYLDYCLEQLRTLDNITFKRMMGEFLLYYEGTLFGGIYDDRLLIKIVDTNKKYNMEEETPYDGAKNMYLVSDIDDNLKLKEIVLDTVKGLKK